MGYFSQQRPPSRRGVLVFLRCGPDGSCSCSLIPVAARTRKLRETPECPNRKTLAGRVAEWEEQLAAALECIEQLEQQLAAACKDSSTSSKPPSNDIVKP